MNVLIFRLLRTTLILICFWSPAALAQGSTSLQTSGAVAKPLTWTVETLRALPQKSINDVRTIEVGENREQRLLQYGGVLLRDLLDNAQLVENTRGELRRSAVIATATDGYKAVFSWAELYLSPIGDGTLIYFERDGRLLDDREGKIALISLKDNRTGARHVRRLQSIQVVRIEP
jgi:hypothetical protein